MLFNIIWRSLFRINLIFFIYDHELSYYIYELASLNFILWAFESLTFISSAYNSTSMLKLLSAMLEFELASSILSYISLQAQPIRLWGFQAQVLYEFTNSLFIPRTCKFCMIMILKVQLLYWRVCKFNFPIYQLVSSIFLFIILPARLLRL